MAVRVVVAVACWEGPPIQSRGGKDLGRGGRRGEREPEISGNSVSGMRVQLG